MPLIILSVVGGLLALLLLAFVALRLVIPAILRARHKLGTPGIDRMEMVTIGGIRQAVYIRGENVENPVILYLHGGPGASMMMSLHLFQYDWEKDFTVVQWDQRNAGKTYRANDPEAVKKTLTAQCAVEDAHEVTQYIKKTLHKEKIAVLGHSWGSVLGTMLVQAHPEDYSAYIAVGQVVNMAENERVGYEKALAVVRAAGNARDIATLEALAPYPPTQYTTDFNKAILSLRQLQTKYHLAAGLTLQALITGLMTPYFTFGELLGYVKTDVLTAQEGLVRFLGVEYDAHNFGLTYQVPVYYMMGEDDYQTPYPLAKAFFAEISAPDAQFFSIPHAGHAPMIENRAEFTRVLLEEIRPRIQGG